MSADRDKHSQHSVLRERIVEHQFIAEILKYFWTKNEMDVQVLRSEFDSAGYDLVISKSSITRHIQFKTTLHTAKTSKIDVSLFLPKKVNGCILWIWVDDALNVTTYRWFGSAPGEPFPPLSDFKVSKHAKPNSAGTKTERPNLRTIPKNKFATLNGLDEVVEKLFGETE